MRGSRRGARWCRRWNAAAHALLVMLNVSVSPADTLVSIFPYSLRNVGSAAVRIHTMKCSSSTPLDALIIGYVSWMNWYDALLASTVAVGTRLNFDFLWQHNNVITLHGVAQSWRVW